MPQCAVPQLLVIQLDFVYHVCACVWAGLLFITSIPGVGNVGAQLEQKHSTLITQHGKNKQKNRCFFLLPFDQSCVVFTEQNNYPKGISMRHMNDVWNLPAL